jgi:hypothetical protein
MLAAKLFCSFRNHSGRGLNLLRSYRPLRQQGRFFARSIANNRRRYRGLQLVVELRFVRNSNLVTWCLIRRYEQLARPSVMIREAWMTGGGGDISRLQEGIRKLIDFFCFFRAGLCWTGNRMHQKRKKKEIFIKRVGLCIYPYVVRTLHISVRGDPHGLGRGMNFF